jgi:hypothetical protein
VLATYNIETGERTNKEIIFDSNNSIGEINGANYNLMVKSLDVTTTNSIVETPNLTEGQLRVDDTLFLGGTLTSKTTDSNITIDPNGSGTLALGSANNTAVNINALAITATSQNALTLTDGTASLALGGTGATSISGATTLNLDCTGNLQLNSSGGTIDIGNDSDNQDINIGILGTRTINIGHSGATVNLAGTIHTSNITETQDPLFIIGGTGTVNDDPTIDDNKDRGILFKYFDSTSDPPSAKKGFFGFDDTTYEFIFVPNATNTTEVISGNKGTISCATIKTDTISPDSGSTITHTNKGIFNAGLSVKNGATSAGFIEFFEDSDNGTNKATLIGPASTADVTITLPSATDTLVGKTTTDTLINKTLSSPNINNSITLTSTVADQISLDINASQTTANVIDIASNSLTTASAINISATGLTSGSLFSGISTSTLTDGGISKLLNYALTNDSIGSQTSYGLFIDYNKTGITASNKTANIYGIHIDLDDSVANDGIVNAYGLDISSIFSNTEGFGSVNSIGAQIASSGGDSNTGVLINCSNTNGTDLKITSSVDTGDFFSITTIANGATTVATVDDVGSNANLNFNIDGTFILDSVGVLELNSSAGVISIGADVVIGNINIGTGGARTIQIGNAASTAINLDAVAIDLTSVNVMNISDGAATLNFDGSGATTLTTVAYDHNASGAITIDASGTNAISIGSDTNTGNINIGSGGARTIQIGNAASTAINLDAVAIDLTSVNVMNISDGAGTLNFDGSGATTLTTVAYNHNANGAITIDASGSNTISIGAAANTGAINIGTGSAARTIQIGNAASTSVSLDALAVNITSVDALSITDGAATLGFDGSGATTLTTVAYDHNASGAITIDASGTNAISIGSDTNTGNINIGSGGARTIQIGNAASTSVSLDALAVNITSVDALSITDGAATLGFDGSGATTLTTVAYDHNASGAITIDASGSNTISIGAAANTGAINIGTGSAARTITMGNTTGATALNLNSGTGGITLTGLIINSIDTITYGSNSGDITATSANGTVHNPTSSNVFLKAVSVSNDTTYHWDLTSFTGGGDGTTLNLIFDKEDDAGITALQVNFGSENLYSGNGTNDSLTFSTSGQSAALIYMDSAWRIINTGAEVS